MNDDSQHHPPPDGRRLAGKVAIVTGAGTSGPGVGTGKAIALQFARHGARICAVDRELERAQETVEQIVADGGEAFAAVADVTDCGACADIAERTLARFGSIETLVNNVGISGGGPLLSIKEPEWDRIMAVNLKSALFMSQATLPAMIDRGGGSITNIASITGFRANGGSAYSASKAGMIMLTRDIAVRHGRDRIRANAIAPGHIYTPLVAATPFAEAGDRRRQIAPLGIKGDAWDIAWAAVFLASDEARFITGVLLPVDGGVTETQPLTAAQYLLDE
jgi:NAD(P)-dependent dehydrogenase (short-subunit alcohol dehydrogenase family)